MSRGPDNVICEYLIRQGRSRDEAESTAEEIIEALEAEDYLAVSRDMVRTCLEYKAFLQRQPSPAALGSVRSNPQ